MRRLEAFGVNAYYNENDPYAAEWLRNLIAAGLIPASDVDDRSIIDVSPDDLVGYRQCHFFAGIGGWPYALILAGWPDDREVWTGSCPCQPLSSAGQRRGHADERHLWPAFYELIAEHRPATVFGEQVASKDGREWLSGVRTDLEQLGYAVGAADLPAAGVGAPHIRQRLFWVADAAGQSGQSGLPPNERPKFGDHSSNGGLAHAAADGRGARAHAKGGSSAGPSGSVWDGAVWLPCLDGKARLIEPGIFPLAHGVPARVGRLRAYGNAIVPQTAAEFVRAVMANRLE